MPQTHRFKRAKVAIACDVCRHRKIKCDGIHPECGPCRTRDDPNQPCTWNYNRSRVNIQRLQREIQELQQQKTFSPSIVPWDPIPNEDASLSWRMSSPAQIRGQHLTDEHSPASAMVGPTELGPGTHGFFGGSSAGNFVARIREAVVHHSIPSPTEAPSHPRLQQWQRLTLDECALPPRSRADALMTVYWDAVHPLYPFVDRDAISQQYERLFAVQAPAHVDSSLLCTLNLIFALCCQLDTTVGPDQRHHSTQLFFERAQKSLDLWRMPSSLESVQVLLLLSQYLQSTNEPLQCWNFVGSAVRMAENLGLHLKECSEGAVCLRDREIMRRVWHGCVMMDRVSAMAYGRPTMINCAVAARTPPPIPVDEEDLSNHSSIDLTQVCRRPSRLDFFVQSLKLYGILEEILRMLYSNRDRREHTAPKDRGVLHLLQTGGASIIDIDGRLMEWEANLPQQLRQQDPVTAADQSTVFTRQSIVLRQRFLHIRLLSLRPVLYSLLWSPSDCATGSPYLAARLAHHCATICVTVAQESIQLAHAHRGSTWATTGLLSAWWYNILFVSSAATVLLVAKLVHSAVQLEVPLESISTSWTCAMDLLKGYRHYSDSIPALISTLDMLFQVVSDRCSAIQTRNTGRNAVQIEGLTPLTGVGDLTNAAGVDWELFVDPASFSWLDTFALEL